MSPTLFYNWWTVIIYTDCEDAVKNVKTLEKLDKFENIRKQIILYFTETYMQKLSGCIYMHFDIMDRVYYKKNDILFLNSVFMLHSPIYYMYNVRNLHIFQWP